MSKWTFVLGQLFIWLDFYDFNLFSLTACKLKSVAVQNYSKDNKAFSNMLMRIFHLVAAGMR